MVTVDPPLAGELRFLWWILAVLLVAAFWDPPPDLRWIALLGSAWLAGFALLRGRWGIRVAEVLAAAFRQPIVRATAAVLLGLLVLIALVLNVAAALTAAVMGGAILLLLAAWRGPTAVGRLVVASAVVGVLLATAGGALEIVLRREPFASRLGVPTEQAKWDFRYDRLWEKNVFRFRSPYEQLARTPGRLRVIALGDSYTWGAGIPSAKDVWPARLERALGESVPMGRSVEVINMAQSGWTTANEAEMLRRLGWQFDPDLVIVQFLVNDALPSNPNFRWEVPHERLAILPARLSTGYIQESALWWTILKAARVVVEGPAGRDRYRQMYFSHFEPGARGWVQLQEALRDMGAAARSRDTPVMLVLFPLLIPGTWTVETYLYRAIHERVAEAAEAAGLEVLDLAPVFAEQGGNWLRWWATPYDGHPNPDGHELAARAIARRIAERGLLRPVQARSLPVPGNLRPRPQP